MAYRNYSTAVSKIVDPNGFGDFTTIASALTASTSGTTIFIRPGTYTENLTLQPSVNLVAYNVDATTPNVTIIGTNTFTQAGTVSISGIRLQTNLAPLLTVSGILASIVNLNNCYLNCTNTTGISFTSSSASSQINISYCNGNIGTTGISLFANSSAGTFNLKYSQITNSGASITANTISAGLFQSDFSRLTNPTTSSGTATILIQSSNFDTSAQNVIVLTIGGSGGGQTNQSTFASGTASAISISTSFVILNAVIISAVANTFAITGTGTVNYSGLFFLLTGNSINSTLTQTGVSQLSGNISFDGGINKLSNYSVGTFIPTVVGATTVGTTTYISQTGFYVRIGSVVTIQATIIASAATGTGNVLFGGFPFTIKNGAGSVFGSIINASLAQAWPAGTTSLVINGISNTTTANIYCSGSSVTGGLQQISNTTLNYQYTMTYQI